MVMVSSVQGGGGRTVTRPGSPIATPSTDHSKLAGLKSTWTSSSPSGFGEGLGSTALTWKEWRVPLTSPVYVLGLEHASNAPVSSLHSNFNSPDLSWSSCSPS